MTEIVTSSPSESIAPYDRYALTAIDLRTGSRVTSGEDGEFESASAIKSMLATLALDQSIRKGIDTSSYSLRVDQRHAGPGASTVLGDYHLPIDEYVIEDNRSDDGSFVITLDRLLHTMLAFSDGVATNAVIEYLDGKDAINRQIREKLGMQVTRLVTDKLSFGSPAAPIKGFQVGVTTTGELASYYKQLPETLEAIGMTPPQIPHYWQYYSPARTSLLDLAHADLSAELVWRHKGGSIFDTGDDWTQGALVDAGMLRSGENVYAIAAATMQLGETTQQAIREQFARRNREALSSIYE